MRARRQERRRGWQSWQGWHAYLGGFLALLITCTPIQARPLTPQGLSPADERTITLWYRNYDSPAIRALVALALSKTPEYGRFRLTRSIEMVQGRALLELTRDHPRVLDLAAVATSVEREKDLLAIPVPIDGGLLGFRVCVVMEDALSRFEGVASLDDLRDRGLRIGQGLHWPDATILQVNGVQVVTHSRYETLFKMLRNDRFDCFARGVSEVLFDLELEQDPELVIEPSLLIAYPMLSYFFVGPEDHVLAQRLQLGMDRAIQDGSFSRYLNRYYGEALEVLALDRRQVLLLNNPYLGRESSEIGRRALETLRVRMGQQRSSVTPVKTR
ncbi:transporter substrate-binding domain-containing protein [Marinobacter xestospongiae]|uniref:transporter substrate-binding domain-containing protein n=1 Tax=Marinobacter xestospongiae TaxID=994319 RepID=UPI002005855B|nr:transporter substrate-binding domain-containing protein [Marinobacter xestospongiae]MCK7568606.1 transporter substrate-binding domain-containing protein [Marinobacter xestospongiae]